MNGATGVIAIEFCHLQHLVNNPLTGNSRIAMYKQRKNFIVIRFINGIGFRSRKTGNNRVHRFKVRRVRHQFQVNIFTRIGRILRRKTKVIFYIAIAHGNIGFYISLKLVEDFLIGFAHDVCQHIQAAAMRHAYYYFFYSTGGGSLYNSIKRGNSCFATF